MPKLLGKAISYGKEVFDSLDSKYNFKQPKVVSFYVNGKETSDYDLEVTGDNCRWYIGQMFHHGESIYSQDFVLGSLAHLFKKTKKGEKVVIEIASSVGQILNPDESRKGAMTYEEQKAYIEGLAKKYHKKGSEDLEITNLEDRHPELFAELRENGIDGFEPKGKIMLEQEEVTSLDIARILYGATKVNGKFFKKLSATKPSQLKGSEETDPSDYYGMIEIALRLSDFLNGIIYQGGEKRQTRYDKIILEILDGKFNKIPQMKQLSDFINETKGEKEFSNIYFDGKEYNKLKENKKERKKTNNVVAITSAAILSVLVTLTTADMIKDKRKKAKIQDTIDVILQDQDMIVRYNFLLSPFKTLEQKKEFMNGCVNNIFNLFTSRYGLGDFDEDDVKYMILSELCRGKNIEYMLNLNQLVGNAYEFIEEILIPNNKILLMQNGIDINPYGKFQEYSYNFEKTFFMNGEQAEELDQDMEDMKLSFKYLGIYNARNGEDYHIAISQSGKGGARPEYSAYTGYLVASTNYDQIRYTSKISQLVAEDFERNRYVRKISKELFDVFDVVYGKGYITQDAILNYIADSYIKNISTENTERIKWSHQEKFDFLKNIFVKQNPELMEKIGVKQEAYASLIEHRDSFENTLDLVANDFDASKTYDSKYLGQYLTKDGDSFFLSEIELNGKKHVIAHHTLENYPGKISSYNIHLGQKIAKEFLEFLTSA